MIPTIGGDATPRQRGVATSDTSTEPAGSRRSAGPVRSTARDVAVGLLTTWAAPIIGAASSATAQSLGWPSATRWIGAGAASAFFVTLFHWSSSSAIRRWTAIALFGAAVAIYLDRANLPIGRVVLVTLVAASPFTARAVYRQWSDEPFEKSLLPRYVITLVATVAVLLGSAGAILLLLKNSSDPSDVRVLGANCTQPGATMPGLSHRLTDAIAREAATHQSLQICSSSAPKERGADRAIEEVTTSSGPAVILAVVDQEGTARAGLVYAEMLRSYAAQQGRPLAQIDHAAVEILERWGVPSVPEPCGSRYLQRFLLPDGLTAGFAVWEDLPDPRVPRLIDAYYVPADVATTLLAANQDFAITQPRSAASAVSGAVRQSFAGVGSIRATIDAPGLTPVDVVRICGASQADVDASAPGSIPVTGGS